MAQIPGNTQDAYRAACRADGSAGPPPADGRPRGAEAAGENADDAAAARDDVDGRDVAAFLAAWQVGDRATADLDRDGTVGREDLERVLLGWGPARR